MSKIFSLIKASMTENMSLFKINTKKKSNFTKIGLPIILALIIMGSIFSYSELIINELKPVNMEYVVITLFIFITTIVTLLEGIYKASGLLFNCKDDNMLLSLPIKKSTVLFIRVFKFYVFEVVFNALFFIPAIVSYAICMKPGISYYIVSIMGILLLPIIPILISCIIGTLITLFSSKFKGKKIIQTIITFILLLGILYFSYTSDNLITSIASKASSINDFITKIYYPAGKYLTLVTDFNIKDLLIFVLINIIPFVITIYALSKIYFRINSKYKAVKTVSKKSTYNIKTNRPIISLIKKELGRFVNSPVFVTNAGFGLILYVVACIMICIKFDSFESLLIEQQLPITMDYLSSYMPVVLFGLICFASLMSSITSSMISLEGKSFSILKSLPVKPYIIVLSKILTAVIIMVPFILIGDLILAIKFGFNILEIIMILIASVVLPVVAETIGIIVNLKYPKMDAENDTEVVKQSMSSSIAVLLGMVLTGVTIYLLWKCINEGVSADVTVACGLIVYIVLCGILMLYLNKNSSKEFNNIKI